MSFVEKMKLSVKEFTSSPAKTKASQTGFMSKPFGRFVGDVLIWAITVIGIYLFVLFTIVTTLPAFVEVLTMPFFSAGAGQSLDTLLSRVLMPAVATTLVFTVALLYFIRWVWRKMIAFINRPVKVKPVKEIESTSSDETVSNLDVIEESKAEEETEETK